MGKYKRMDRIRTILTTYQATQSIKETARQLKTSKNTVREYLRRSQAHSPDLATVLSLDDETFEQIMYPEDSQRETDRASHFSSRSGYWIRELRRVGVNRQLLWEEYRREYHDGYGYSQFCERLRGEIARKDLTLSLKHEPGKTLMVDFAGKKLHWVDRHSGEVHECEVLVAVLPHSQYTFAITHTVKLTLLQILEDRYENAATIICSQLPVNKWYDYLEEPTLADAILDRIIPKAHRIELKGKSLRKKAKHLS